jgi:hypothetical protein
MWEPTLSAIPRQRASLRQAPIAAEAAPTLTHGNRSLWEPTCRRSRGSGPGRRKHPSPLKRLPHSHTEADPLGELRYGEPSGGG